MTNIKEYTVDSLPAGSRLDFERTVPTEKWEAQFPRKHDPRLADTIEHVIFTYTGGAPCHTIEECCKTVHELQRFHMRYHLAPDIPYNFLLGGDDRIYSGRTWLFSVPLPPSYVDKALYTIVIARIGPVERDPEKQMKDFQGAFDLLDWSFRFDFVTPKITVEVIPDDWNTYDEDPDFY